MDAGAREDAAARLRARAWATGARDVVQATRNLQWRASARQATEGGSRSAAQAEAQALFVSSFTAIFSQLVGHPLIKPKSVHNPDFVEAFAKDFLYFGCVEYVLQVKKGSLGETSPMLMLPPGLAPMMLKRPEMLHLESSLARGEKASPAALPEVKKRP